MMNIGGLFLISLMFHMKQGHINVIKCLLKQIGISVGKSGSDDMQRRWWVCLEEDLINSVIARVLILVCISFPDRHMFSLCQYD